MRTVLIIILLLGAVIGVIVFALRRRERDEIHSIDHYRNALHTLDDMRPPTPSVRILSADEAKELRQPHPGSLIRSDVPPPTGQFFEEVPPEDHQADIDAKSRAIRHALHHDDPKWAISRMQDRHVLQNREVLAAIGAVVLVVVLIVVGIAIGNSGSKHSTTTIPPVTRPNAPPTTTTTTVHLTKLDPQPGFTANAATYFVPATQFVLDVAATQGDCWATVTTVDGQILFNAAIAVGSSRSFQHAGGISVSLGAPGNVAVKMNAVPVDFPSGFAAPLKLSFVTMPTTTTTAAPASTTTTSSTTTTAPPTTQVP